MQPGDTLGAIAASEGVSLAVLLAANAGLVTDPNFIQAGWELALPGVLSTAPQDPPAGPDVEEYTVRAGDTLGAIAARWGTTVAVVTELNGVANPDVIAAGQRLRRPGSAAAVSSPVGAPLPPRERNLIFERYPLDLPPAVITGGFREDYGGYLHRGVDLGCVPVGAPIVAPAPGVVTVHRPGDGWGDGSFGVCVVIDHPGTPWWSIYAHMEGTTRSDGETVQPGDVIGAVGFTGRVVPAGPAGAHLHWQLSAHPGFPPDFALIANPLDFLLR